MRLQRAAEHRSNSVLDRAPGRGRLQEMRPRTAILLAAALVFVVMAFVPFGPILLYPLSLFTTWVHEMGHGLTALAVGGEFRELSIFGNGSGLALCAALPGVPAGLV